ncbi:phage tail tape measure protein [Tellurirhabdus rosea]|uniref:phage tail tape measure protein n=1 Tax=Tellurirhabdus rosea TaxID=2674997 RepID=UPI0022567B2F|nr:phage tail tape measure protein [Tellurirhabdus rosea]
MALGDETRKLTFQFDGKQAGNELKVLQENADTLKKKLKDIEKQGLKGSPEWLEAKKAFDDTNKAATTLQKTMKASELTYGQLINHVGKLEKELKGLVPGQAAYNKKLAELGEANKVLNQHRRQINEVKNAAEELAKPGLWDRTKNMISGLGVAAVASFTGIAASIGSAFGFSIGKFREFDAAAQELSAVSGLVGDDFEYLKKQANEVGPAVGKSGAEMLEAYKLMGSAKPELLANKEALAATTLEAIKLSQAGKIDLPLATKVVAESLNQWGEGADKAGRFVNVIAAGAKEGAAEISEMSMSLKASGTVAAAANVSFEQTNAMLQSLSTIALKGEQSGTMLRNVLIKLQSGAKETNPAVVGLDKALENLGKQNLSTAQLAKMFGTENIVAAQHIIKKRKEIGELTTKLTGTKEAYTQAQKNTQTLDHTIKQATATVTGYAVSFGQKLAPAVKLGIEYGLAFMRALASLPKFISDNRVALGLLVVGLVAFNREMILAQAASLRMAALERARAIASQLAAAADRIRAAQAAQKAAAEAAANVVTTAGTAATNAATVATSRRTIAERLQAAQATAMTLIDKGRVLLTNALTVAQNAFNVALKNNPIGLVITVVAGLAFWLTDLYGKNQKVRASFSGLFAAFKEGIAIISRMWQAIKNLDFSALSKEMDTASSRMAAAFTKGYHDRITSEMPKAAKKAAEAAGQETIKTNQQTQNTLTEEEKKAQEKREKAAEKARKKQQEEHKNHLEKIKEANAEALQKIDELENENYVAFIRRTKGEVEAEKVKLAQQLDAELLAVQKSLASAENKQKQRAAIFAKYEWQIVEVEKKATEESEKKKEEKVRAEYDRQQKLLSHKKTILDAEHKAELMMLDGLELANRNNANKLIDLQRDRLEKEHKYRQQKLDLDTAAEKAKAQHEIKDKDELEKALRQIEKNYDGAKLADTQLYEKSKLEIEKAAHEERTRKLTAVSTGFQALLKGDVSAFASAMGGMVQGEKKAWQQRLDENMKNYEAVGQMAVAAVQFLNDLAQKRAEKAIAQIHRERDAAVSSLQERLSTEKALQDAAEAEKQRLVDESNAKVQSLKDAASKQVSDLEAAYREISNENNKAKLDEQLAAYQANAAEKSQEARAAADDAIASAKDEAEKSIAETTRAKQEAITAANNVREEKIIAAEATRDAEINAINARKDIDQATRAQLIAEAQAKFEQEKSMASQEADHKITEATKEADMKLAMAQQTMDLKISMAELTRDAELEAIKEMQNGNTEAAKAILARAKADQKEKIKMAKEQADQTIAQAEKEKREKLKLVEQEKATRIANQKELNRQIASENAKAAAKEKDEKRKAWQAQKRADIATAIITGALAMLKSLAGAPFPLNLVFAAVTAAMTAIQVVKIRNQPEPQFAQGGFIAQGGKHGSRYGEGGIALVDRASGREVGEMEGGEAIVSADQTEANLPLLNQMFANARNPSKRRQPIDRAPMAFKSGGVFESGYWDKEMYLFGSKKKKEAEKAARAAEAEAAAASGPDMSEYSVEGADVGSVEGGGEASGELDAAKKMGSDQIKLLTEIRDAVKANGEDMDAALSKMSVRLGLSIATMGQEVSGLKGSINAVEGAVREVKSAVDGVQGAVHGTNQGSRLDALLGAMSKFSGK